MYLLLSRCFCKILQTSTLSKGRARPGWAKGWPDPTRPDPTLIGPGLGQNFGVLPNLHGIKGQGIWLGLTWPDQTLFECVYNISVLDYFFLFFLFFFFYFLHHVTVCHMSWWWCDYVLQRVRLWPPSGRIFLLLIFLLLTYYSSLWTPVIH